MTSKSVLLFFFFFFRLATVTRVDQDFDIRRVQPIAEKYVPRYRRRRTTAPKQNPLV